MPHFYLAYGLPITSDIELPALHPINSPLLNDSTMKPIQVTVGFVPENLIEKPLFVGTLSTLNDKEFKFHVKGIACFYVKNSEHVYIEPLCNNWDKILSYFYSNCLAVVLFQRNLIPFHVSGIFINTNKVLLFAAPSGTGKSTTALMLQQKGYALFTDDTAILHIENDKILAQASYPLIRLWQNTITKQSIFEEGLKKPLASNKDKFGFSFHDKFISQLVEVAGIVFLEESGSEIRIKKLDPVTKLQHLRDNIYRKRWLDGMQKQNLQFEQLTGLANILPAWKAIRPKNKNTFNDFASKIDDDIIRYLKSEYMPPPQYSDNDSNIFSYIL